MAITKDKQFKADAIIIAIGREQSPPLINSQPGVFQIIESKNQRQVQIATGEGLKMAMQVEEYVNNKRNR
jgi:thioredoxin reductase